MNQSSIPAPPQDLWTYQQVCKLFRRSYPTIYLWQRYHGMPTYKWRGRNIGFRPEEVIRWARLTGRVIYQRDVEVPHIPTRAAATAEKA